MSQQIPCCLLKFGSASEQPKRPMSLRIRPNPSTNAGLLSAWRDGRMASVLQVTWALVLRCYTDSGDICFGYQHVDAGEEPAARGVSPNVTNLTTVRLAIGDGDSTHELVKKAEGSAVLDSSASHGGMNATAEGYLMFNTIVMIRTHEGRSHGAKTASLASPLASTLPEECLVRLHVKVLRKSISIFLEWKNHDMSMEQVKSISNIFENLLTRVLSPENTTVADLGFFTERDWQRIRIWNEPEPEVHERCIHDIIHDQMLLRPEEEAICAWDGSLSFKEFDRLATQLAFQLTMQGVGPEVLVPLCFDKSMWYFVAMLAVLKAGGAFVPLDPAHPPARLQSLAKAVKANLVLCSEWHTDRLQHIAETVVPLSGATLEGMPMHPENFVSNPEVTSSNAAYVIFTSGSTGQPKGTLLEHRAYCSSAMVHGPRLLIKPESRVLQFAAHTFDASLTESLSPFMHGACVCVPSEESRLNDIADAIRQLRANYASLTPSFIEFLSPSAVPEIKTLILAGEAMSESHRAKWSTINLVNGFGPTETAVTAAINSKVTETTDCKDIGLPMNAHCWIVNPKDHDQLVPVGSIGEMLLEGPTLARGYIDNPEKTAEAFIFDPAWIQKDPHPRRRRRFYKTGDLVRYNADIGSLTYIGRKDTQIKLHGQRVELGEIESCLNSDASVKHCLVLLAKTGYSQGKLAVIVSLSNENECDSVSLKLLDQSSIKKEYVQGIRERLYNRLPTYMVPSNWLYVEALPFLPSGKLDRKATATWLGNQETDPYITEAINDTDNVDLLPSNEVEKQLVQAWSRTLNLPTDRIPLTESFLRLGGDSIAAMTCMSQCKKHGISITVQDILRSDSIRELATRAKATGLSAVYEEAIEEPFDLSPIQSLHFNVRKEGQGYFNQSILTHLTRPFDEQTIRPAIEALVSKHSMLRARFARSGNARSGNARQMQQRVTRDITSSYRLRHHSVYSQDDVQEIIGQSQSSLSCISGPLLSVDLFDVRGSNQILSMVADHLVVDIVSWRIILEDLEELLLNPTQSTSGTSSLPFQTWCQLQAEQCRELESDKAELQDVAGPDFAYWGVNPSAINYGDVNCASFTVDTDTTTVLMTECHKSLQTEPVDVILAALLHSFGRTFSDRSLPVIYNEGHGREPWDSSIDISRTVGWFTTLYPILVPQITPDDPIDTVIRVKDCRRRVSDNGRSDFARRVGIQKHHSPMEINLNYLGQHRDLQREDGLFQLAGQMAGETSRGGGAADFGRETPRFSLFEISAVVVGGQFRVTFSFDKTMKYQNLIQNWVSSCHDLLKSLGSELQSLPLRRTLSDFPLLSLNYESLKSLECQKLPRYGVRSWDLVEDIYPCSKMQQGVLLSQSRDPSLYAVRGTWEVQSSGEKSFDVNRLSGAWKKVVDHHAMLRTVFATTLTRRDLFSHIVLKQFDSNPVVVQCADDGDVLSTLDGLPQLNYRDARPPHRFTICETSQGKVFCRLELSHVAMDGASISLIMRDLRLAYADKLDDKRKPLFRDFIGHMQQQSIQKGIDYWCSYLSGLKPCHLPSDLASSKGAKNLKSTRLDFDAFTQLQGFCTENGITLANVFNAAWGLTLSKFCKADEVCFTYTASLRDAPVSEIDSVIGPVMNLLVCRMKLTPDLQLVDILRQVQNDYVESLPYLYSSLIDIQHALKMSKSNLFNSGVSYRKLPAVNENDGSGLQFSGTGMIHDPAEVSVYINVETTDNDAQIELNYWTNWLSDRQAESVGSAFIQSLLDIANSTSQEIQKPEAMSKQDIEQIAMWNSTVPQAIDSCVHIEFERQAAMQLGVPAITTDEGDISYSDLSELSSCLAIYLIGLGVSSNTQVVISFDSSPWTIVSILAVWKTGGSCIPLEKSDPSATLGKWIAQNEVQVALASPNRAASLEGIIPYVIPVEDSLFDVLTTSEILDPTAYQSLPADAAYTVFTTRASKSLVLEQRAILTSCNSFAESMSMDSETRTFQLADYTTSSYLQEVFGTLLKGGCVCIPQSTELANLESSIYELQATTVQMTPSQAFSIHPSNIPSVQQVVLVGESLTRRVRETLGSNVQLHAVYGTAECSPAYVHNSASNHLNEVTNIGFKAACVNSWVVDPTDHDLLVPIGAVGELVLEGPLARSYLDEQTTADDSFIKDPKWISNFPIHGAQGSVRRMLKTGDLVQYASDGSLVYIGRKDQQAPGQKETDLLHVEDCIQLSSVSYGPSVVDWITCSEEEKTTQRLAAFVLLDSTPLSQDTDGAIVRQMSSRLQQVAVEMDASLSSHLSYDMLPTLYIPISLVPLTASGKVNRQVLKQEAEQLSNDVRLDFYIEEMKQIWGAEQGGLALVSEQDISIGRSEIKESYWKEYLADVEPCIFPSLQTSSFGNETKSARVVLNEANDLHTFCRRNNLPPSSVYQLAWGLVLRCYTGLREVCFGFSDCGREALLPCALNLSDDLQVRDLLKSIEKNLRNNKEYHIPISQLLQGYKAEDIHHFNTAFYLNETSGPTRNKIHSPQLAVDTKHRIVVRVEVSNISSVCHVEFSEDDIPETYVNGVASCFDYVLRQIVQCAPQNDTIGGLDLLDEQSCTLLQGWNRTLPERFDKCVHELIEEQGHSLPISAAAVCAWDADFTYSQLDALSTRLAQHLQTLGVKPEVFVALCFEKSAWAVVTQLAILKAGGAFASLDPTHPDARLRGLVADLDAKVILCSTKYHGIASKLGARALVVNQCAIDRLPEPSPLTRVPRVAPSNAAYAIFTSGTTGMPKATVIQHMALSTTALQVAKHFGLDSTTRALQFSSYTFDVSVLDVHGTLINGGCICIPNDEERVNDLSGTIRRMGVTHFNSTPGIANTLDPKTVPSLRTIVTGGEKMTAGHIERWGDRCVINAYGPSESTIVASLSIKVDKEGNRQRNDRGSIGGPFCGRAWVVDPYNPQRLLPVGAVGELVLEGCNVARGYLNNEKKTKESFIENPKWSDHPLLQKTLLRRERMYRTGDLVRYNPDGTLTFISRMDSQIKLNGQRIELEEIEIQCSRHLPQNSQSIVDIINPKEKTVARCLAVFFAIPEDKDKPADSENGDLLLTMTPSRSTVAKQLWSSLQEALPQYMIPNIFFPLSTLPCNTSAKIDRRRLLGIVESLSKEHLKPFMAANLGSPQAERVTEVALDSKLRCLWEEVLELNPGSVSADDSFFGVGGDSFAAMNLVSAAESEGLSLTVADIFKFPVLADMANSCGALLSPSTSRDLEPFSLLPSSAAVEEVLEEVADSCQVSRELICDVYPCSPVQEGLITASIQQRGAYMAHPVFKLADTVDITKFKAAWQQTVDEVDVLRTRIVHTASANFVQAVIKSSAIQWRHCGNYRQLPADVLQIPASNGDSLTSYTIAEFNGERSLVWSIHHSLYDGWSIPLILQKVEENYSKSSSSPLSPTVPYSLFVEYLRGQDPVESDNFWRSYLSDMSSPTFPQNKSASSKKIQASSRQHCSIKVVQNPQRLDVTLPVLIRAAWATVLSLHTESGDVCFGETLMGRNINLTGVTDIAGPVLTTVPTRIAVDNGLTLIEYLDQIHRSTTDMIPHQHTGLHRIRQLNSDTSSACEFQNLLVIQSAERDMNKGIWAPENTETSQEFFTYPLVVECKLLQSEVQITAYHDEQIISSWHVSKLLGQLSVVLNQFTGTCKNDTRKLGDLDLVSPGDSKELAEWNGRPTPSVDRTIHDLIREQLLLHPDAPSIHSWDGQMSYKEMYDTASTFAKYLSSLGVGPEVCVPICMDKSVWMIVTIMGILISGGAFVPLDPAHPTSRHEEIIEETCAKIVLCTPKYCDRYVGKVETVLPADGPNIARYRTGGFVTRRAASADSSNMAYVIFTSGSTGRPKGIIIEHRAFVSSTMAYGPIVHLKSGIRVFQFASLTFDAAVMEILSTLIFGGCVCIPSEEERLDDIAGAIRRLDVSWLFCTPSLASIIEPSTVPSLEVIACGGEMMSHEAMTKWSDQVLFINAYGPTETAVYATLNTNIGQDRNPSCIGKGIPSTLSWIVDPENPHRLCPVGVAGELALEGPALAREYLRNPEKTAATFITDPRWASSFNSISGLGASPRRIYLTGDLARYMPDGSLEYIGRKDHQVKLHGQRMELGEIEYRLHENSYVRHAVVILPKSGRLQSRLVAILSLNSLTADKSLISSSDCELVDEDVLCKKAMAELITVQSSLESQLPIYMVPQTWAVIKTLPMLVSGKIDRKKITGWIEKADGIMYDRIMQDYDRIKRGEVQEKEPENEPEKQENAADILRNICVQVLNIPSSNMNLDRSFVGLGGDSITGMALVSRARKAGLTLSLHDILQSASINSLAEVTEAGVQKSKHHEKTDTFFSLSPIQKLYFQHAKEFKGTSRFNQSITVQLSRRVRANVVEDALKTVVDRHAMLRARFRKSSSGNWLQKVAMGNDSCYQFRIHTESSEHEFRRKISETHRSLDIINGPIIAADLFESSQDNQILFLVANHLCIDMVSWRIILNDIEEYIQFGSLSAEKPVPFQAWCELLSDHCKRENYLDHLPFSIKPTETHYWGMNDTPNTYGQVNMRKFVLDEERTACALGSCHKSFQTEPLDLLLAVAMHSFHRTFADRQLPTFYNEGHGRQPWDSSIDLSGTVGWFTSICPIQVDLSSDDILETLRKVKDTRRSIINNGTSYFAQSLLCPEKQPSTSSFSDPLEVVFNYLGKLQQLERDDSLFQHYGQVYGEQDFELIGDMGSATPRFALFEISAIVIKDQLQFVFTYNKNTRRESQISQWVSECEKTLNEALVLLERSSLEVTTTDYPLLPITQDNLQKLVTKTLPCLGIQSREQIEDIYPCTPMQEGILISQLREPSAYMLHTIFELKDNKETRPIDPERLRKAWQLVVNRHSVLRTVFVESTSKDASFDQVVVKELDESVVKLQCDDYNAVKEIDTVKLQDTNLSRDLKLPHQLTVCKTSTGRVFVKLEMNHAIIDGGSMGIVLRDLAMAYDGKLPILTGPLFRDYIQYIRGLSPAQDIAHWKQYMQDIKPCNLPSSGNTTSTRQLQSIKMTFNRFTDLRKLCQEHSVTLANLTLSAWALVLREFTGMEDVCFGYLSAGRDAPVSGIQDAVGIFINMLCCRVKFTSRQSLSDIYTKVQADYIQSIPHQSCSLAKVQNELGLSSEMLFNTALSIQNQAPSDGSDGDALSFSLQKAHDPSEFPVTVNVVTARGHEGILLRYWSDAVSENQAETLVMAIAQVFTSFVEDPFTPISNLSGLRNASQQRQPKIDRAASVQRPSSKSVLDDVSIQNLIDQRVHEIVSRIVQSGDLPVISGHNSKETRRNSFVSEEPSAQTMNSTMEHVRRRLSTASCASRQRMSMDLEKKLMFLWGSALSISADLVNRQDSFFRVGGDSIKAMKMASAAREEGLVLTVADVFRNPVFEDMLAVICSTNIMHTVQVNTSVEPESQIQKTDQSVPSGATSCQTLSVSKGSDLDTGFLQGSICPKIGFFKGGISDVLPVTDFQALSLTASLFESRWMLNYFYLDGRGRLDHKRLRESCSRVVDAFDILRTVFVCSGDQFYQVILKKVRPSIIVYETENSLDAFTESLQQRDRDQGLRQGEQFTQFIVAKRTGTDHHRLLVRLSHAQYDGVCMSRILEAIKQGYEGSALPPTLSFANYMRLMPSSITPEHYKHWTDLLQGSKMTEIVRRDRPNAYQTMGAYTEVQKSIDISQSSLGNITVATLVQAAWAMTLAKLSAQSDVVFGLTINGRNASIPGVQDTIGPCLNIVPVRVAFEKGWTGLDLIRYLQDQQVSNMPYESLGFREIIRRCTSWPDWTYFTTSVLHQNVEYEGQMQLDDTTYRVGGAGVIDNLADLTLVSKPREHNMVNISLGYSSKGPISPELVSKALGMVCDTISSLSTSPMAQLPSPDTLQSLPAHTISDSPGIPDERFLASQLKTENVSGILIHSAILSRTWQQVLPSMYTSEQSFQLESSFFDFGGDLFSMGQLAWLLQQEGLQVTIEELLERPSFLGHMAVLARNNGEKEVQKEVTIPEDSVATVPKSEKKVRWKKAFGLMGKFSKRDSVTVKG